MKKLGLYIQSGFYLAAGVNHFWHPRGYVSIMPPWIPAPFEIVYMSGMAEAILGILLIIPPTRIVAAWGIVILLIAVFPANIQMLINYSNTNDPKTWIAIVRLPIQVLLIWLAWIYTRKPGKQSS